MIHSRHAAAPRRKLTVTDIEDIDQRLRALSADVKALSGDIAEIRSRAMGSRAWDVMVKLSVPAVLAVAGAGIAHEVRIAKIEETRFTPKDMVAVERRLEAESHQFTMESETRIMAAMSKLPPMWLVSIVEDLKRGQGDMVKQLTALQTKVELFHKDDIK